MKEMYKLLVLLERRQYEALRKLAFEKRLSMSFIVRKLLDSYFDATKDVKRSVEQEGKKNG